MLDDTFGWSHARGNEVVPSPWQATRDLIEVGQNGRIGGLEVETHLFGDPTPDRIVGGHSNHHLRGTRRGRPHSSRPCRMVPDDEPSEEAVPTPGRDRRRDSQMITGRVTFPPTAPTSGLSPTSGLYCAVPLCR